MEKNFDDYLNNLEVRYLNKDEPVPELNHPDFSDHSSPNQRSPARRDSIEIKKPPRAVKVNNHYIAPKKKGLDSMVRDHSKVTLEVFERNLAKRKGLKVASSPARNGKNFV